MVPRIATSSVTYLETMRSRLVVRLNLLPSDRVKGPWSLTHSGIMIALSSSWSVMPRSWAILFSSSYTVCSTVCMNFVKFSHLAHTQAGSRIFDGREVTCPTQMSEKSYSYSAIPRLCTLDSNLLDSPWFMKECGSRDSIPPRSWHPSCLSLDFQSDLCQVQAADRLRSNLGGDDGRTIRPRLGRRSDFHRRNRFRRDRPPSLPPRPRARPRRVAEDSQAGGAF